MASRTRAGYELPLLLLGAFRSVIDELHEKLAASGHGDARPLHGFALQAIGPDGATTSELGRRLGVSKQAAGKTVDSLEQAGYVRKEPDPDDGRAMVVRRTPYGEEMLALSDRFFESFRARLAGTLGAGRLAHLEDDLEQLASSASHDFRGLPGWLS